MPHFKPGKALREAVDQRVGALRAAAESPAAGVAAADESES